VLTFSRFYFASSNDLLDILSNGNQPLKVSKHLTKLFDSMAKLKLRVDENKEVTNLAYAMIAKDGEVVDFDKDVHCENQVTNFLNYKMPPYSLTRFELATRVLQSPRWQAETINEVINHFEVVLVAQVWPGEVRGKLI
jgi:dynein heavy chain